MKYFIIILIFAFVACNQEKKQKVIQKENNKSKTEISKEQPHKLNKKEAIAHIRDMYAKINELASTAEVIEKEMMEESAEGGQIKAYKHNGKIIKIIVFAFGETGRATKEYYFENEKLIFAFTKEDYYDRPMYVEGAKISKTDENRYYFYNEELFLWLDPDKNEIDLNKAENTSENILEDVNKSIETLQN